MKYTQDEILDALRVINDTCKEITSCKLCPLRYNDNNCYINEVAPLNWEIADEDHSWRALK